MEVSYIEVNQPIGTFYMCSIKASQLLQMVEVIRRSDKTDGIQRDLSPDRTKEIANFCSDPDALFPTPIVVSVHSNKDIKIDTDSKKIFFPDDTIIGDVIDGQHRLGGISRSSNANLFDLPVVLMFNLNTEEKAYVFSTINSNQRKVNPSLIYDLFEVSSMRNPKKTAHQIARTLNSEPSSPFFNRLKMLGKKEEGKMNATLSQGTFCKSLLQLISNSPEKDTFDIKNQNPLKDDPNLPLRKFFINNSDHLIAKILTNCFNAVKIIFPEQWENPHNNILWKTTGFNGIMNSLPRLIKTGFKESDLSQDFFEKCFFLFKKHLKKNDIKLTNQDFGGGGIQVQRKFASLLIASIDDIDIEEDKYESNIEKYINNIPDVSIYEIYDIANMLKNEKVIYGTIRATIKDGLIKISHPMIDTVFSIPQEDRTKTLSIIENKFMNGLDYESWLNFKESISKD